MTIRLLVPYTPYPANAVVKLTPAVEAALLAAGVADSNLAGGIAYATAPQNALGTAAIRLEGSPGETSVLTAWALTEAFRMTSATRNADGAVTGASIVWPDGTPGTYTADTLSSSFPGATDAWHATYVDTSGTLTVTQPAVTRDADGAVTAQPSITIA